MVCHAYPLATTSSALAKKLNVPLRTIKKDIAAYKAFFDTDKFGTISIPRGLVANGIVIENDETIIFN